MCFQIIPQTMFSLLAKIIQLLTNQIREVPTRLEKEKMKEFAQLEERYEVCWHSHGQHSHIFSLLGFCCLFVVVCCPVFECICDLTLQNESHWYSSWNFDFYTLVKSIQFPFKWYQNCVDLPTGSKVIDNQSGYHREFHSEKLGRENSFGVQQYYSSYNLKCLKLS